MAPSRRTSTCSRSASPRSAAAVTCPGDGSGRVPERLRHQADVNTVIAQARRLTQAPYHAQYQVILSDIFGADGGEPSNTDVPVHQRELLQLGHLRRGRGERVAGMGSRSLTTSGMSQISPSSGGRRADQPVLPDVAERLQGDPKRRLQCDHLGPDFAYTPQQNPGEWQGFLSNAKSSGTVPNEITNHEEGDGDDPVADSQAIESTSPPPASPPAPKLSANEYQPVGPADRHITAWYLAHFTQSTYANAMHSNWVAAFTPNLAGVLTECQRPLRAERQLVGDARLRRHDRFPRVHLQGESGSTAISAAKTAPPSVRWPSSGTTTATPAPWVTVRGRRLGALAGQQRQHGWRPPSSSTDSTR